MNDIKNIFLFGHTGRLGKKIYEIGSQKYKIIKLNRNLSNLYFLENSVVIDVTSIEGTEFLINFLIKNKINLPLIIGTTGNFNQNCIENMKNYSKNNVIFKTSNFSQGVSLLCNILKEINNKIDLKYWNIEMEETHHKNKKDSPSGTAKTLSKCLNFNNDDIKSLRKENIHGVHKIKLKSKYENLEIIHTVNDNNIFAISCIDNINQYINRENGFYIDDI